MNEISRILAGSIWCERIIQRRRLVVGLSLALFVLLAPGLALLKIDNRPEVFFLKDHLALLRYETFQFQFGRDNNVRIVIRSPELWSPQGLEWLRTVEEEAASLFGVFGSAGIYGHHEWRTSSWPPLDIERFRREVLADDLDRKGGLIAADGQLATIAVALYNLEPEEESLVLEKLGQICDDAPIDCECSMIGLPILSHALDESVRSFAIRYYPLLLLFAVTLLGLVFQTIRDIAVPLIFVLECEVLVLGLMGYSGVSINFVNMIIVPILFVVALATVIHVQTRYRSLQSTGTDSIAAITSTYREKAWPVYWAGVTTAVGFGSMAFSDAPPLQELGAWIAFGLTIVLVVAFLLLPCLLTTLPPAPCKVGPVHVTAWLSRFGHAVAFWALSHRRLIIVLFLGLGVLSLTEIRRLDQGSNILDYFPPSEPAVSGIRQLEELGIGSVSAEVIVETPKDREPNFRDIELLLALTEQGNILERDPDVLSTLSAGDLLANVRHWEGGELEWGAVKSKLAEIPKLARMFRLFSTDDGSTARLTLQLPAFDYFRLEPVLEHAKASIQGLVPEQKVWITGQFPLILSTQRYLLRNMAYALGLTMVLILGVLAILLKPGRYFWCSAAVNLWPLTILVGAMAWLKIPLDSTTVMVAPVALALAVDDTFHTLGYLRACPPAVSIEERICQTLAKTVPAQLLSSLILGGGFLICSLTQLAGVARFCSLVAITILAALAADLFLFPALVYRKER